jgi:hypothetical protein
MTGWSNVNIEVDPTADTERVAVAVATSPIRVGVVPEASVKKILCTILDEAAAVACELRKRTESTLVPDWEAVTRVTKVPLPSDAVFAAAIVAIAIFPDNIKIGVVFAGILLC